MTHYECFVCGASAWHDYTQVEVFDHYTDLESDTVTYCSDECEAEEQRGDWAPKWCLECGRMIRTRPLYSDLRDANAENFVMQADATVVCRRCAGTD